MTSAALAQEGARTRVFLGSNRTLLLLAGLLFLAPNLLAAPLLGPVAAAAAALGALASAALLARAPVRPGGLMAAQIDTRRLTVCGLLAGAVFILGGEGHLLYANSDWLTRDAVLSDLIRAHGLPRYMVDGQIMVLRAPLGMYLAPALAGKALAAAGPFALWLQNSVLLGVIFYFLAALGKGLATLPVMFLFAGLCALARLILVVNTHRFDLLFTNIIPLDQWCPSLQYSSAATQFFWVPNHALPGWWLAVLLLLFRRGEVDLAVLGVTGAALALWSPLAVVTLPILALAACVPDLRSPLFARRTFMGAAAAAGLAPLALYLVLGASTIEHGGRSSTAGYWFIYLLFITLQLPIAVLVMVERRRVAAVWRPLFYTSFAILLILPWFTFGPGNDLVMRGAIPALTIVSFCFAEFMLGEGRAARGPWMAGWALLALASLSTLVETARALEKPAFPISPCTVMEASREMAPGSVPSNYVLAASAFPKGLIGPAGPPLADARRGACWPGLNRAPRDINWLSETPSARLSAPSPRSGPLAPVHGDDRARRRV